jgi:transcriptional regulator with XRE-family HTH domain
MDANQALHEAARAVDLRLAVPVACRLLGLTQAEVARDIGVSAPFLSNYVRGRRDLSAETLVKLRRRLGLDPEAPPQSPPDTC